MTNASVNQTVTDVNSEGQAVKVVQVASNAEQIAAAGIGLFTAGPLGAIAAWGTIKAFAGKWTPWTLTGLVAAPVLGVIQLTGLGVGAAFLEGFSEGYNESQQSSEIKVKESSTPVASKPTPASSGVFNEANFGKIQNGMTLAEVEGLIGAGDKDMTMNTGFGTMVNYTWGNVFGLYGSVSFMDGAVSTSFLSDNR